MIRSRIIGTGHYLPGNVLTNFDLEKTIDTTDEWIRQRTGILQRYIVEDGQATSDLGAQAASGALARAGVPPDEIDCIICATLTPDHYMPSSACLIQHKIGTKRAAAYDMNAACSGFVYGLETADALIRSGVHKTILVIGAEVMSSRLDWTRRETAVLFGDGAGAVVVRGEEGDRGIIATYSAADGSAADMLHIPAGGTRQVITAENIDTANQSIVMNGRELYKRAIFAFGDAIGKALDRAGMTAEDIDLFIPHQANKRIIVSAAQRVGLPEEKIHLNLDKVANTSAASIPIALDDAIEQGKLSEGSVVLLAAFGAGLTWASAVIRW